MKIFLDDIRDPKECLGYMYRRIGGLNPIYSQGEWYIVRTYDEFVNAINKYHKHITHVSFDHDLADNHYHESMYENQEAYDKHLESVKEKTGFDCAKSLKEFYELKGIEMPTMFVHSMNPVGMQKIIDLFK